MELVPPCATTQHTSIMYMKHHVKQDKAQGHKQTGRLLMFLHFDLSRAVLGKHACTDFEKISNRFDQRWALLQVYNHCWNCSTPQV